MTWISAPAVVFVLSIAGVSAVTAAPKALVQSLNYASPLAPDSTTKPAKGSIGVRLGLSRNPKFTSEVENRISDSRPVFAGVELTVARERHFRLGIGLERFGTQYTHIRTDTIKGQIEDNQYTGWLLYLSPGIHSRLGRASPLGFGFYVDLGYLWASENYLLHGYTLSSRELLRAARPKLVTTYEIMHYMSLHLECGWMMARHKGRTASYDFYDEPQLSYPWTLDFSGPYFGSMVTISLPSNARTGERRDGDMVVSGDSKDVSPTFGLRASVLPRTAESQPARWDFNGSHGASLAVGIQVSLVTANRIEVGLGVDLARTPTTRSLDSVFGGSLHAECLFAFASVGYEGLPTPVSALPLGLFVDIGHLWSREVTTDRIYDYTYSFTAGLEGPAARAKITISPDIWREAALRIELGWLFAALGERRPSSVHSGYTPGMISSDPTFIDFSGPSITAMIRLSP